MVNCQYSYAENTCTNVCTLDIVFIILYLLQRQQICYECHSLLPVVLLLYVWQALVLVTFTQSCRSQGSKLDIKADYKVYLNFVGCCLYNEF